MVSHRCVSGRFAELNVLAEVEALTVLLGLGYGLGLEPVAESSLCPVIFYWAPAAGLAAYRAEACLPGKETGTLGP